MAVEALALKDLRDLFLENIGVVMGLCEYAGRSVTSKAASATRKHATVSSRNRMEIAEHQGTILREVMALPFSASLLFAAVLTAQSSPAAAQPEPPLAPVVLITSYSDGRSTPGGVGSA